MIYGFGFIIKAGDFMAKDNKKTSSKIDKAKAVDLDQKELLPVNPLLEDPAIDPNDEIEMKVQAIHEIESLAELNKQQLMVKRQQVELEVDNKKLDTAKKTVTTLEKIIDSVANEEVLERVAKNIKTPQDMKYMAEAAEKLSHTLKGLMNPNVADEFGNKKRHKINFMFKSNGPVQAAVQVDTSDD